MEQRIKIIWMLSLAAMLLIIAGQGYWLWNQYRYKNEECADEMYRRVMDAMAVNDSIRRTMPRKTFGASNVSLNTSISLSYRDQKDSLNPAGRQEYRQVVKVGTVDTGELLVAESKTITMPNGSNASPSSFSDNLATPKIARAIASHVTHEAFSPKITSINNVTNTG